jgi:hypothetical protein
VELFASKTVVDLAAIQEALAGASTITAFRYLNQVPYRRSYNHNGRYYALHEPCRYDRFGLWSWKGIHFSADGSLKDTVRRLVREAAAGASQRELQERLHARAHNTLLHLVTTTELAREEVDGRFIYLHPDAEIGAAQLAKRRELITVEGVVGEVTEAMVIPVLLTLLHYPGARVGEVARRLKGHSPPITRRHVQVVFERFNLDAVGEKGGRWKR